MPAEGYLAMTGGAARFGLLEFGWEDRICKFKDGSAIFGGPAMLGGAAMPGGAARLDGAAYLGG